MRQIKRRLFALGKVETASGGLFATRLERVRPRRLGFRACALVPGYSPHTLLATLWMRAILAHCSSSVSLLPISQLAKPHWGDR